MTLLVTPGSWSLPTVQAALDADEPLLFEPGKYDLGDAQVGLDLRKASAHVEGRGRVMLKYHGTGRAVRLARGTTGLLRGIEVQGTFAQEGIGVEVDESAIRVENLVASYFAHGVYFGSGQATRVTGARILACKTGIGFDPTRAQNHLEFRDLIFRSNGRHVEVGKARGVRFVFCDFEAAAREAVAVESTAGGAIQGLAFEKCWFEYNNLSASPTDEAAEVEIVSRNGLSVRSVRFTDCYWGLVGGQHGSTRRSRYHLRLGVLDAAEVDIRHNYPATTTEIPGTTGLVVDRLSP